MHLLYVFGQNSGDLGLDGNITELTIPASTESSFLNKKNIKFIIKGGYHSFIVLEEKNYDVLYGTGNNGHGQLGLSINSSHVFKFTEIELFTNLKKRVKFIACGFSHTFIVTEDFKCYGLGFYFKDYNNFKEIDSLDIEVIKNIKQVICGGNNTALLLQNGDFYVHGDNSYLQLDDNKDNQTVTKFMKSKFSQPIIDIAFGFQHCLMVTKFGEVYGSGNNASYHPLGIDNSRKSVFTFEKIFPLKSQRVYCGYFHSFILTNDFDIYACGWNVSGELLLGFASNSVSTFKKVNLSSITIHKHNFEISVGCQHFFLKTGNEIYCGGYNGYGELGLDGTEPRCLLVKHPICEKDNRVNQVICGGYGTLFIMNDKKNNKMEQFMVHNLKKILNNNEAVTQLSDVCFYNL